MDSLEKPTLREITAEKKIHWWMQHRNYTIFLSEDNPNNTVRKGLLNLVGTVRADELVSNHRSSALFV
jgi:hypothetical protein